MEEWDGRSSVASLLSWWPPEADAPLGKMRAEELIAVLLLIAEPVVDEAEADLRQRVAPDAEIVRSRAPLSYLAHIQCAPGLDTIRIGAAHEAGSDGPESNSLHLHRDGRLRWRRD